MLWKKNICGKYHQNNKKSNRNKVNQTNIEAKNINIKLKIDDIEIESYNLLKQKLFSSQKTIKITY